MISAGSRSATAFFNMYLAWRPRILSSSGTCAANSTKGMIEERHAALNRCRHADLILLHEQLHQIGLLIGEQHSRQRTRRRPLLPAIEIGLIRKTRYRNYRERATERSPRGRAEGAGSSGEFRRRASST